nr:immunoglobulin heavy chain junction region [Mus musculus]
CAKRGPLNYDWYFDVW